jgi:hypothetical protein
MYIPTREPTAPDAALMKIVSPSLGRSISINPPYAVLPGIPKMINNND